MFRRMFPALLLGTLLACACESLMPTSANKRVQVETARASQEIACQRHLRRLLDLRDEGLSCDVAKAKAAAENPLCNLSFSCPQRNIDDGGAE